MGGVGPYQHGGTFPWPSNTSFATALGGGIDYRLIRLIAWRVEGDYITTRIFQFHSEQPAPLDRIVVRF